MQMYAKKVRSQNARNGQDALRKYSRPQSDAIAHLDASKPAHGNRRFNHTNPAHTTRVWFKSSATLCQQHADTEDIAGSAEQDDIGNGGGE
mmetsp:Transcript_17253/g.49896  ORF Transcript_17253/g.49896 Transcript_17253/m.49896 type:complete len:91 (+) Transcript_17253:2036-2308(+)